MSGREPDRALAALRDPRSLLRLDLPQWSVLVQQARAAGVLARLGNMLHDHGIVDAVPAAALGHLRAEQILTHAQHEEMRMEIDAVRDVLARVGLPVILLKGAAYLALQLTAARGRSFSDLDLLVPKTRLNDAESALMRQGWMTVHHTAYDQRYYREWMHELPPLRHVRRHSVLDVHHNILPETARLRPDAALLLSAVQPVAGWSGVATLAPADMVLHSMAHLFHNDDLGRGLRDLSDLDMLLRQFSGRPDWWSELAGRAAALNLLRPLYYGLRCTRDILGTPVPDDAMRACAEAAPNPLVRRTMSFLWTQSLHSQHATSSGMWTSPALFALYLRAHWLRMPPMLLARHLSIKALTRLTESSSEVKVKGAGA